MDMKFISIILISVSISSCATTTFEPKDIIPELFDSEQKKGKIFVFSNHTDKRNITIRVNNEEREMKHTDIEIFDLKDGQNSIYSFRNRLDVEFLNCDDEPYTFDTEMFQDSETHYFVIQYIFNKQIFVTPCLKDVHINEERFLWYVQNPRNGTNEFFQDLTEDFFREFIF